MLGQVFGRLTVFSEAYRGTGSRWFCRCECGNIKVVRATCLRFGSTRSCGCLQRELTRLRHTKHGASAGGKMIPEWNSWKGAKHRCNDPKSKDRPAYGGRGIKMCEQWEHSFTTFLADMGRKPSPSHSLDRINVNGNYEPGNCRWATPKEQSLNRRPKWEIQAALLRQPENPSTVQSSQSIA